VDWYVFKGKKGIFGMAACKKKKKEKKRKGWRGGSYTVHNWISHPREPSRLQDNTQEPLGQNKEPPTEKVKVNKQNTMKHFSSSTNRKQKRH